jgi:hypothetical protein
MYSIIIALEAVAMVIPPILPTAILIGLNVSGEPLFQISNYTLLKLCIIKRIKIAKDSFANNSDFSSALEGVWNQNIPS